MASNRRKKFAVWQADGLLLLTAAIWGFAFVAQRVGMYFVGPFSFNAIRFLLGGFSLLPLMHFFKMDATGSKARALFPALENMPVWMGGVFSGVLLFGGASLQQVGLLYTTAGKAGFITGLYVVLVPVFGSLFGQRHGWQTWMAAALAVFGLYLLSVTGALRIATGDLLVLVGAFFWALHFHWIDYWVTRADSLRIAFLQFLTCGLLSGGVMLWMEPLHLADVWAAAIPILYGGLMSVGVAYTLQIVAQRKAHPAHAAVLLSLEAVFATIGGMLFLGETLSRRGAAGAALMLVGMVVSQWENV